jgi:hypothetical protein
LAEAKSLHQWRGKQEFRKTYAKRSGIEGTISQAVRAYKLRRARYIGLARTHLQLWATAVAINLHRLFDWLSEGATFTDPYVAIRPPRARSSTGPCRMALLRIRQQYLNSFRSHLSRLLP